MDFSQLMNTISGYVPNEIAGIESTYLIGGAAVVLLLLWLVIRSRKSEPKRELVDLVTEHVEQEEPSSEQETEESSETSEEDGFMPSDVSSEPQELHISEEPQEEEVLEQEAQPEPVEAEPVEEVSVPEEEAPVTKQEATSRKKRESTRDGRKIVKADFSDFSGHRVLIAEDNLINQKVINGVLNESGIDVVMADDGQFVMDILEEDSNFEIILMDAHMPRVDGFEATRMIRANPAYNHIAVVALSGDTAADDIRHMREAGMEEHLEKPLKMDALYDVMSMYYTLEEEAEEEIERAQVEELEIDVDIDDLPSLDYQLGLEICGSDEAMYKELLKEFFVGYKDSSKKLRDVLVKKEYAEAQAILIDVKGTASNLGAKQFIQITDHFLKALSEGNTAAYGGLFKDYQNYLLILLKSIQSAFKA